MSNKHNKHLLATGQITPEGDTWQVETDGMVFRSPSPMWHSTAIVAAVVPCGWDKGIELTHLIYRDGTCTCGDNRRHGSCVHTETAVKAGLVTDNSDMLALFDVQATQEAASYRQGV